MAHIANHEELLLLEHRRAAGRPYKYPWGDWLNGETWVAEDGTDFTTSTASFVSSLATKASKDRKKLTYCISLDKKTVVFKFTEKS